MNLYLLTEYTLDYDCCQVNWFRLSLLWTTDRNDQFVQSLWHIIIWNRGMSQGLNHYTLVIYWICTLSANYKIMVSKVMVFFTWHIHCKECLKGNDILLVCHIISLIEFRKPFTQSKCINCIGIQNKNILKKLIHTFIQTVILKLVMLNYG